MAQKDFAAFTITRNEPLFLRVWCNYYASVFPQEDLYILDNESNDGSVQEVKKLYPDINIVNVPFTQSHDILLLKQTVERQISRLLKSYCVVVFSETDEYLIPNTQYDGLLDYCKQFKSCDKPFVRATGWNPVQNIDKEPALKIVVGEKLLEHRSSMWRISIYDKTVITKQSMHYQKGFHNFYLNNVKQVDHPRDPDLCLLHAWRLDFDEYCRRHMRRVGYTKEDVEKYFRDHVPMYAGASGDPHSEGPETQIPAHWVPLIVY